jgi:hypothetical protein
MTREEDLYQITVSDQIDTYRLMAIDDCNELQKMLSIVSSNLNGKKKIAVIHEGDERELIDCASSLAIALATIREAVETYQLVSDRVADERDEITTRYVLPKGVIQVNADLDEAGLGFRLKGY